MISNWGNEEKESDIWPKEELVGQEGIPVATEFTDEDIALLLQQLESGKPQEDRSHMYDDSPEEDDIYKMVINPNLQEWETEEARMLAPFSRGLMIITGYPGSGKGVFANVFAWKMRRYFGKKVVLDYRPRELFDYVRNEQGILVPNVWPKENYYYRFDERVLDEELSKVQDVAKGSKTAKTVAMKAQSNSWLTEHGIVKFQNAVMVLDEFWRYMHNRRPMSPIGITIGGIIKIFRHLDLLLIGVAPRQDELDEKACLTYVTHEVRCEWMSSRENTTIAHIHPVRFVSNRGVMENTGKPFHFKVDGGLPRPSLGGRRYFDLYASKNAVSFGQASKSKESK